MLDVIYDGQCGFCVGALRICRALDVRGALRYHDSHAREAVLARFPELAAADLAEAMFSVAGDRSVHRGFFAFRQIVLACPLMWPLLPLLYFPGSRRLGPAAYAWIARNRHRLGCRSEVCEWPDRS